MTGEAAVYRIYDSGGSLLYVGMSSRFPQRLQAHGKTEWWRDVSRVDVTQYEGRKAAAEAEAVAIATEFPLLNIKPGHAVEHDTLEERRAAKAKGDAERQAGWEAGAEQRHLDATWPTDGRIACTNCGRRPERFPKNQKVEETRCGICGCKAFVRDEDGES